MPLRAKNTVNFTACTKVFLLSYLPSSPPPVREKKGADAVNSFSPDFSLTKE